MKLTELYRIGDKVSRLTIIGVPFKERSASGKTMLTMVNCRCDCGNEKAINFYNLINEYTKTCGCVPEMFKAKLNSKVAV